MSGGGAAAEEDGEEEEADAERRAQSEKQEPHIAMWGTTKTEKLYDRVARNKDENDVHGDNEK